MTTFKDLQIRAFSGSNDLEEPVSITGLETFSLSYKVCSSGSFSLSHIMISLFISKCILKETPTLINDLVKWLISTLVDIPLADLLHCLIGGTLNYVV